MGWLHRLWHTADTRHLWLAHCPSLLDVYDAYNATVQRADASRLLYMHVFGGVYADLDVAPCDALGRSFDSVNRSTPQLLLLKEPRNQVTNFFVASAAGHPFWHFALNRLRASSWLHNPVVSTGPQWLHKTWMAFVATAMRHGCAEKLFNSTVILDFKVSHGHSPHSLSRTRDNVIVRITLTLGICDHLPLDLSPRLHLYLSNCMFLTVHLPSPKLTWPCRSFAR